MENQIFIVEDDRFYSTLLQEELKRNGVTKTQVFNDPEEFLKNLYQLPKIVLLDHKLGEHNGIDVLKKIKAFNANIEVIFLSGQENLNIAVSALKYGAFDYVEKNEGAMARIVSLIKKVKKIRQLVADKNHERKYISIFYAGITTMFVGLVYIHFKFPHLFDM
jgi:DNA-binding NtrC family response regulator